ncbi:hypothetical protein PA25_21410 [Pseudoalteromonas sp. A25]|nr:hypothetical protein PA25_21410 [Pseudoalteromonas sp. A25]
MAQCQKDTPSHGTILITESDNYIEFHGVRTLVGKVLTAQLFMEILCLQVKDYSGNNHRVLLTPGSLSAQDWSRLCRVCFAHHTRELKS